MDAVTSSTALTTNSTNTTSSSKSADKTSEKSFDEEMKTASKSEETKDVKDSKEVKETEKSSKTQDGNVDNQKLSTENSKQEDDFSDMYKGEIDFTDFKYHNESQSILSQNIQNLLNTKDLMNVVGNAVTIDYDCINMSESDANFFADLVQNTDMSMKGIMNQVSSELIENSQNVQKSIQVSSVLMEKLHESMNSNRPFRIDFDKDVSVIIKVNRDGSLAANFIPGDKAVEQYLRNNIASLRQRFDEENLAYSELSYSNSKGQQQRRKKENNNE